jgi:hypothetical protein
VVGGIQWGGLLSAVDDNGEHPYMFFLETLRIVDGRVCPVKTRNHSGLYAVQGHYGHLG